MKPLVDVNNGQLAVNMQDDLEAVGQSVFLKTYFRDCARICGFPRLSGLLRRRVISPSGLRNDRPRLGKEKKQDKHGRDASVSVHSGRGLLSSDREAKDS
jgi:hypothetical protein